MFTIERREHNEPSARMLERRIVTYTFCDGSYWARSRAIWCAVNLCLTHWWKEIDPHWLIVHIKRSIGCKPRCGTAQLCFCTAGHVECDAGWSALHHVIARWRHHTFAGVSSGPVAMPSFNCFMNVDTLSSLTHQCSSCIDFISAKRS